MDFSFMTASAFDIIGVAGFCLYVTAYTRLTLGLVSGDSIQYFSLNMTAASFVMVGLFANFNLAAALIQGFFITMSFIAIMIRLLRRNADRSGGISQDRAAV